jgi:hypothetical protein
MLNLIHLFYSATYPTTPGLGAGSASTGINATNYNALVDNINAIGADLVDARGDGQVFPGTDHTASQPTDLDDTMQAIRHMLAHLSGETNYYDAPAGSLKTHNHTTGQGGTVLWSAIGDNDRFVELHPPSGTWTTSLFGAAASGTNTGTTSEGNSVVSNVGRNYHQFVSSEGILNDYILAVEFVLPKNFTAWATTDAIQIWFYTSQENIYVNIFDAYIYKSGYGSVVASAVNNLSGGLWEELDFDAVDLGSWSADDIMVLYFKMSSKDAQPVRVGNIKLNYTS